MISNDIKYASAVKAGRCYNGAHRDRGQVVHAVEPLSDTSSGCWFNKAICGAQPSGRSYGWDNTSSKVNCTKCIKRLSLLDNNNQS
jgi:hypothetical protein